MPTVASLIPSSRLPLFSSQRPRLLSSLAFTQLRPTNIATKIRPLVFASSAASFDELNAKGKSHTPNTSKKSILSNLIQEVEPLDVSLIQKDVPHTTVDAMKRTISGMLGLLPSDRFHVLIEAFWEPLSKLLVSSMMTGSCDYLIQKEWIVRHELEFLSLLFSENSEVNENTLVQPPASKSCLVPFVQWYTLRNAEYRLCLEKNLGIYERNFEKQKSENDKLDAQQLLLDSTRILEFSGKSELQSKSEKTEENPSCENIGIQGLGEMTSETQQYILHLQSRLSSVKKELRKIKRKNAALQMQQFVGEEKNDLLDYLRSLQPEKVAELSEPTSPELKEIIHCVIHGLLATLSPKMHSKAPPLSENTSTEALNIGKEEDCAELVENTSLQFQPLISVTRDYLARLLFWCMLLGHYLRGLEYRLELMELLTLSGDVESNDARGGEQVV
ncbi:hypothetical protein HHK36_008323 [Tetracentron sinense]|uniref:MAR-binding filament-like protein 1 n=1 Tax=Tetracentron sinense TaxID=13715 RepID=A0A834ZJB0_TETSI|nr:hypothetical protein HHK36_008323 [Tetracentron sinense]